MSENSFWFTISAWSEDTKFQHAFRLTDLSPDRPNDFRSSYAEAMRELQAKIGSPVKLTDVTIDLEITNA